jgi:hypothetical protein
MSVCRRCSTENHDIARFCLACGSPRATATPPQEVRKVVTVVFSDLDAARRSYSTTSSSAAAACD